MPAAAGGILKKKAVSKPGPPPPPPPIVIRGGAGADPTGLPPPKPRRFLSRAVEESQGLTRVLLFTDDDDDEDDEPKTEESYDYRDIDFATEVYSFRPFPPRPKPPRKRSPPPPTTIVAVNGHNGMESSDVDPVGAPSRISKGEHWMTDADQMATSDDLSRFLEVELEGRMLSMDNVDRLDAIDIERDQPLNASTVHFGDAEILEGMTDDDDDDRTTSGDYSEMEFSHVTVGNGSVPNIIRDYGGYEPIGKPCPPHWLLHQQRRVDMSDFVPPVPSTVVDPFSWRRRGRRRYCDYGYDQSAAYWSTSALDKISDGCQEIEDRIVACDLTPPGTLLRTMGVEKKRRRKAIDGLAPLTSTMAPPRPPPPLPPKLGRTPSPFLLNDTAEEESELPKLSTDDRDDVTSDEQQQKEQDGESEIIPEAESKGDVKIATDDVKMATDDVIEDDKIVHLEIEVESCENEVSAEIPEPPTRPSRRDQSEHGPSEQTQVGLPLETLEAEIKEADCQYPFKAQSFGAAADVFSVRAPKRASRRDSFERDRRPPRPPLPTVLKPIRPSRQKRYRSAEPLMTSSEVIVGHSLTMCPSSSSSPANVSNGPMPKRSASFHTAEDIRRRIDIQAQNFLRIPRRRDCLTSSSGSLKYECLRRTHSPAPLYSLVNKGHRKTMTSSGSQTIFVDPAVEAGHSPTPPVPPPPPEDDGAGTDDADKSEDLQARLQEFEDWAAAKRLETMTTDVAEEIVFTETDENVDASPANRPLPAPPVPSRHRGTEKKMDSNELRSGSPSGVSVVFCHEGGVVTGKMAVVPELKVLRLTVGHLEASTFRVSHVEADVFKAHMLSGNFGAPSLPPSSGSSGGDGVTKEKVVEPKSGNNGSHRNSNSTTQEEDEDTDGCTTVVDKDSEMANQILRPDSVKRDDSLDTVSLTTVSLDDGFGCYDTTKDDQLTSGSASYVTCDETLHGDDDVGITDDLDDDDFDFNLELEGDDEDAATGCQTPTELEMDVTFGSDVDGDDVCMKTPILDEPIDENCNVGIEGGRGGPTVVEMATPMTPDSSSSSSSGIEGIVKMRRMKLKGRLADSTNSWYDDGDVPGQMADNDVSDHRRHPTAAVAINSINESGSPVKSIGIDEDSDDVDGSGSGSLIKQRIAELFESQSGGSTTGSGGSGCSVRRAQDRQCRRHSDSRRKCPPRRPRSKFYLAAEDAPFVVSAATKCEIVSGEVDGGSDRHEAKQGEKDVSSLPLMHEDVNDDDVAVVVEDGSNRLEAKEGEEDDLTMHEDVNGGDVQLSSEDEEDGSVASSSSPRNLSAYSDKSFVSFANEEVVTDAGGPTRSRAFHIARELMTSEKVFVDVLNLLTKDFLEAIDNAAVRLRQPIVPEDVLGQILDCLPQLKSFNEDLLRDLEERIEKWDEIERVSDVIVCKGPFLKLYTMYIKKFPVLTSNLDEACKKYPHFAQVVRDFEMSDRCKKLELKHYMLKPVQRIPQYRMLLQDYLKNIEPDSPDFAFTEAAVAIVSEVASHANDSMKEGDKFAKLLEIQSRIAGNHEVIKPGRTFVKAGELWKLCRKEMQLRTFVLFSDALLHLSVTSQGLLRIHHELPLSNMKVSVPTQEDFQNEFSVISVARSFTLAASSPVERDEWISELNSAIRKTVTRHETFLQAKLHQLHIPEHRDKNEVLGQQAPVWIPDARVTMCQLCLHEFTLTFRRHHCRACGKVVCSVCSANRAPLFYRNYETARVCDECFVVLKKQIEDRVSCNDEVFANSMEGAGNAIGDPRSQLPSFDNLKAQFKKYYRGGSSVDQKHKRQLPRVLKEVCANDSGSTLNGYLYKRFKRTWRRGWFVIKDKVLYTYRASQDVAALDSTPLLGFEVVTFTEPHDGIHQQLIFELRHPGHPSMEFYAESLKSADRWLEAVRRATVLE